MEGRREVFTLAFSSFFKSHDSLPMSHNGISQKLEQNTCGQYVFVFEIQSLAVLESQNQNKYMGPITFFGR